jgi:outer membrane protein assembly factor BamA
MRCYLICLLLSISFLVHAQQDSTTYKTKYTPLPFIAYSPDTRLMFGGLVLRQFKPRRASSETRPSNIQLTATYTLNRQLSLRTDQTVLFPQERWIWKGGISFKKWPQNYWGVGPDTKEEDEVNVNYQSIKLSQRLLRKIANSSYIGPQLNFTHMYDVHFENSDEQPLPPPTVTGSEGSTNLGFGVIFNWDKRDNILTPTKNHFVELSALVYSTLWQSDFNFTSYTVDARKYYRLQPAGKGVLAFQTKMQFTTGSVPFEEMGLIGGENIMRGYLLGRFRDKHSLQAQTEYRQLVFGRFGAVVFAAMGNVMPKLQALEVANTKWAVGAGLRYNINLADPAYIRVDYGIGKDTSGFYITFGEAF